MGLKTATSTSETGSQLVYITTKTEVQSLKKSTQSSRIPRENLYYYGAVDRLDLEVYY